MAESVALLSSVVVLLLQPLEILLLSQLCKTINKLISSNDSLWQRLCVEDQESSFFVPGTKLPAHSWQQVYVQMRKYRKTLVAEQQRHKERLQLEEQKELKVTEMLKQLRDVYPELGHIGISGNLPFRRQSPPTFAIKSDSVCDTAIYGGFEFHPALRKDLIMDISTDLIQIATMHLDLLDRAEDLHFMENPNFMQQALFRYIKFLHLKHKYKKRVLVPTIDIEYVWVSHMLRPSMYIANCESLFGEIVDHSILLSDTYSYLNKAAILEETCELYEKEYGEKYCAEEVIEKYRNQPLFTTTGYGPVAATLSRDEELRQKKQEIKDIHYSHSFIGDIGIMENIKEPKEKIGLKVTDLLLDGNWLSEFNYNIMRVLKIPINTNAVRLNLAPTCRADLEPGGMSSKEVFTNLLKAYEKFLFILAKYPPTQGHNGHPSFAIDVMWHAHMICPKIYAKDMHQWVGYLVNHEPWPDGNKKALAASVEAIDELWEKEFGISIHREHTVNITY